MGAIKNQNQDLNLTFLGKVSLVIALIGVLSAPFAPKLISDALTAGKLLYMIYSNDQFARLDGVFANEALAEAAFSYDRNYLLWQFAQQLIVVAVVMFALWILKKQLWDQKPSRR